MKTPHKLILFGFLGLAGAAAMSLRLTSDSHNFAPRIRGRQATASNQEPLVEQQALETARKLAALTSTPEEQQLARDALRVADHELDLAFADALRAAKQSPQTQNPESRSLEERIQRTGGEIEALQEMVKQLTAKAAISKGSNQENLQKQIELAQAELALDEDELADAKEDLARAGGDAQSNIQRLLGEHEAAQHANTAALSNPEPSTRPGLVFSAGSLITEWRNWRTLRAIQAQLLRALQGSQNAAAKLAHEHDALEQHVRDEQARKKAQAHQAASLLEARKAAAGKETKQAAADALTSLHRLSDDQKNLADLDKRIQDQQDLISIYDEWNSLVGARQRASFQDVINLFLWIVLILLLIFLSRRVLDRLFSRFSSERKQLLTLRAVVRFTLQALGVIAILFVIFGLPGQMSTVLGLAGAGLTVALKDFIVSFFGWFVLMGRNGIRVGDWVEINGVGGEVIDIGLLRTILLETGNWTDSGHLTGRRVAFVNSFAVEGHYFNFSTSGQWLWDELRVLVPSGMDPYSMIDKIRGIVAKATEGNVQLAEQEWQRVTRKYGVSSFSAEPAINVRPTSLGVEVIVRYITRAKERHAVRSRLSHSIVELLHGKKDVTSATDKLPALTARGAKTVS